MFGAGGGGAPGAGVWLLEASWGPALSRRSEDRGPRNANDLGFELVAEIDSLFKNPL